MEAALVVEDLLLAELVVVRHGHVLGVEQDIDHATFALACPECRGETLPGRVAVEDAGRVEGVEELLRAEAEHEPFLWRGAVLRPAFHQHVDHLPQPVGP